MPKHELSEYDNKPIEIGIESVPRGDAFAIALCVDMVYRSLREPSPTASKGYLAAAKWFALADRGT